MYDFQDIEDYFQYIIDNKVNGQGKQSKELFNDLSEDQELKFYIWYGRSSNVPISESDTSEEIPLIKLMKFFNY